MSVQVVTHLNFQGQARAALAFYQAVFGGQLTQVTHGEFGRAADPVEAERIAWGQVVAPDGFRIMAFDVAAGTPCQQGENAFFVSLRCSAEDEAAALWQGLAQGASIVHPLAPAKWSPLYGMLKDRFGVVWLVDVAAGEQAG